MSRARVLLQLTSSGAFALGCSSGTAEPLSGMGPVGDPVIVIPPSPPPLPSRPPERFGAPTMNGRGETSERYTKANVTRNGQSYLLMANGWGPRFESQAMSWEGTSFKVLELKGRQGTNYEPATYPTVFCGVYSDSASGQCGLPARWDELRTLDTGWSWAPADVESNQQYNAAFDVWLANGPSRADFSGFFMVWLRDPPGQQPAGTRKLEGVSVEGAPGVWDIWTGEVNGAPIVNYVRAEREDTFEIEFDVLDFMKDSVARDIPIPGTHVLSVAVGFEIWNGPVTNLETVDFYVAVNGETIVSEVADTDGGRPNGETLDAGRSDAGAILEAGPPDAAPQ